MSKANGRAGKGNLIAAGILLLAAAPLLFIAQPTWADKWHYMTGKHQKLADRVVFIDPGELLKTMEDDLINLVMLDVRDESSWNQFHLPDAVRVDLDGIAAWRPALRKLSENSVVVLLCNDEIKATEAWKLLTAMGIPNVYILEGGMNHWLSIYGAEGGHGSGEIPGDADGSLRHDLPAAMGDRHPAANPDPHHAAERKFEPRIKIVKKGKKSKGCG